MQTTRTWWLAHLVGLATLGISFTPIRHRLHHPARILVQTYSLIEDDDNDMNFYQDLEKAKKSKFGSPIPKEELQASASSSEAEFLQAMKEAKKEFQEAKEELGFDVALDAIIGKLREEDNNDNLTVDGDGLGEFQ